MLPQGFTRVEWIQGNGDAYVGTGFIANQDTRIVMDFQSLKSTGGWPIIGSRASSLSRTFTFGSTSSNNAWLSGYNTGSVNSGITEDNKRHVVDKNKNLCYLDGKLIAESVYSTFTTPGELRILKFYSADGDDNAFASLKIWSVQIYDNGTLVRDYVPVVDKSGEANLWDDVNEQLAEKAGTFVAGPTIPGSGSIDTLLLLHGEDLTDASQYARVLTNSGVTVSDAQSKFGGKSLYFNGSSYLAINDINLLPAVGDFTIDWWEYRTASSEGSVVFHQPVKAKDGTGTIFGYGYQNAVNVYMGNVSGSFNIAEQTSMGAVVLNQWVHRAVVRSGSTFYLFADGALQNTITSSAALARNVTPYIGRYDSGSYLYYKGYIDEFRVSEGARWTENFTPPTEAEDIPWGGNDDHTLLLLHGEDLTDASPSMRAITNVGAVASETQSKFGGKSLYFTSGAHLKLPSIDFGSGDFTVDWWELATASDAGTRFTNMSADSIETSKGLLIGAYETKANIYMASNGASSWDLLSQTTCFSKNYPQAWIHRAVVRNGSKVVCYANGKQEYSYDIGAAKVGYSPNYPAAIGAWTTSYMQAGYYFAGYLDEFRISDIARWTADFVPPSKPYESPAAVPSAPSSLAYTQVNDVVSLDWPASPSAEKYRVYLDYGLIAETTSTEYTDTIADLPAAHVYAVTAVNEFGESDFSEPVRIEYWGDAAPDLIYDRTPADIEKAVVLINKRLSGENLTEDEQELWDRGLRGCYNTSDVNRVEYHTRELQNILNSNGYNIHIDTQLWAKPDIMRYSDIIRYLGNIKTILDAFGRSANAPELPSIDRWIDYIAANDIEKILYVTRELIYGALAMFRRAGTFAAGNDYVTQVIRRA